MRRHVEEIPLPFESDDYDGVQQRDIAPLLGMTPQGVGDTERRAIRKIWRMQVAADVSRWGLRQPLPRKP